MADFYCGRFDFLLGRFDSLGGRFDFRVGRFDPDTLAIGRFDFRVGRFDRDTLAIGRFDQPPVLFYTNQWGGYHFSTLKLLHLFVFIREVLPVGTIVVAPLFQGFYFRFHLGQHLVWHDAIKFCYITSVQYVLA